MDKSFSPFSPKDVRTIENNSSDACNFYSVDRNTSTALGFKIIACMCVESIIYFSQIMYFNHYNVVCWLKPKNASQILICYIWSVSISSASPDSFSSFQAIRFLFTLCKQLRIVAKLYVRGSQPLAIIMIIKQSLVSVITGHYQTTTFNSQSIIT